MEESTELKKANAQRICRINKTPLRHNISTNKKQKNLVNFFVIDPTTGIFNFSVFLHLIQKGLMI
jgi:hypothetical protein